MWKIDATHLPLGHNKSLGSYLGAKGGWASATEHV